MSNVLVNPSESRNTDRLLDCATIALASSWNLQSKINQSAVFDLMGSVQIVDIFTTALKI